MVNLLDRRLNWGDRVIHPDHGEGIVLRDSNISLIKVVFKENDNILVFREDDNEIRVYGGEW